MDIEAYKSGHLEKGLNYSYFVPAPINRQWEWKDPHLGTLLEKASISLGELNSFARLVPNIDLFIQLHVTKEAVISSRIEGTQTNIDEALMPEEEISPEKRNDWLEVRNYSEAMKSAIKELEHIPLSSRLLCKTHERLLSGVRGEHKMPSEFRRSQNWIGGANMSDAVFIPPAHTYVNELMGDLENFLHNENIQVPVLIRTGISHYQFETIHPFLDCNGRIGRLLITLYLVDKGMLKKPTLYLSDFFERNKGAYYDSLTMVRMSSNLEHWIRFFLVGVAETAQKGKMTFEKIIALRQRCEADILNLGKRAKTGQRLLVFLYSQPIVSSKLICQTLSITHPAANQIIKDFQKIGILKEITGFRRNRLFVFSEYLGLFEK